SSLLSSPLLSCPPFSLFLPLSLSLSLPLSLIHLSLPPFPPPSFPLPLLLSSLPPLHSSSSFVPLYRCLPTTVSELQAEEEHRLLHPADVHALHPHHHLVLGL